MTPSSQWFCEWVRVLTSTSPWSWTCTCRDLFPFWWVCPSCPNSLVPATWPALSSASIFLRYLSAFVGLLSSWLFRFLSLAGSCLFSLFCPFVALPVCATGLPVLPWFLYVFVWCCQVHPHARRQSSRSCRYNKLSRSQQCARSPRIHLVPCSNPSWSSQAAH